MNFRTGAQCGRARAALVLAVALLGCCLSHSAHAQYASCTYTATVNPVKCGSVNVGASAKCASVGWSSSGSPCETWSPSGSPTVSGNSDFTVSSFSGYADLSTYSLVIQFAPQAAGARSATVNINLTGNNGTASTSISVSGTGVQVYGTLGLSTSSLNCGTGVVGRSTNCGTITVTANGGAVTLASTPYTLTSSGGIVITGSTCTAGESLASGQSCTIGPVDLNASNPGAYSGTISVATSSSGSGSGTVSVSGNANAFTCVPNQTSNAYCLVAPMK